MSKSIVLVGGCFDVLHLGHIKFLKKAKSFGDYLVILLESDENIKKLKGPTRPFHNQKQDNLLDKRNKKNDRAKNCRQNTVILHRNFIAMFVKNYQPCRWK